MSELKPWLKLIYGRPGRLLIGALLMLAALLSGLGLLALSGWFITETALVGVLLAASLPATINLYVPGGGIRFCGVSHCVALCRAVVQPRYGVEVANGYTRGTVSQAGLCRAWPTARTNGRSVAF